METTERKPLPAALKDIVQISPALLDEVRRIAHQLYMAERLKDAEILLKGILVFDSKDAWALSLYASVLRKMGAFKEAIVLMETAHSIDPENRNIVQMRDELLNFAKAVQEAKAQSSPA